MRSEQACLLESSVQLQLKVVLSLVTWVWRMDWCCVSWEM